MYWLSEYIATTRQYSIANNRRSPRDAELQRQFWQLLKKSSSLHTTCVKGEEGVANFAALIIRNENPHIVEIVAAYHSVISTVKLHGMSSWRYLGEFFQKIFNE